MKCMTEKESLVLCANMTTDRKEELEKKRVERLLQPEKEKHCIMKDVGDQKIENKFSSNFSKVKRKISVTNFSPQKGTDSVRSSASNISEYSNCDSGFSEMDDCSSMDSVPTRGHVTSSVFNFVKFKAPNRRKTAPLSKKDLEVVTNVESSPPQTRKRSHTTPIASSTNLAELQIQSLQRRRRFLSTIPSSTDFPNKLTGKRVSFESEVVLDDSIRYDDFVEACHLIKSQKIDINKPSLNGIYPLHRAATEGSYECLQLLIDQGAEVNITDHQGWTPLHDAVFHGHINCVLALVRAGANLYAETNKFYNVLELAEGEEMLLVVGRMIVLKELGEDCFSSFDGLVQTFPSPDRETCV